MYCHGISPSFSGRQQSRLCTAMAYHPHSQTDSSPDCVLPWPSITLILRQTTVQTVYCHGISPSFSDRQQSRLCTAMAYHPHSQTDSSPDCVLPWHITLILRQTTVQTVYCHGLASPSFSGRQQPRLCTAMA